MNALMGRRWLALFAAILPIPALAQTRRAAPVFTPDVSPQWAGLTPPDAPIDRRPAPNSA